MSASAATPLSVNDRRWNVALIRIYLLQHRLFELVMRVAIVSFGFGVLGIRKHCYKTHKGASQQMRINAKGLSTLIGTFSGFCLLTTFSSAPLKAEECIVRGSSLSSNQIANLQVGNVGNSPVRLSWINFQGKRQEWEVIQPGGYTDIQSYSTHLWVIENVESGDCEASIRVGKTVLVKVGR